ncbi:MAG: response regulator [Balneolaceae bacterium]|nr:response regulator [Balneolaceae bacterium]
MNERGFSTLSILIVEDNLMVALLVEQVVGKLGCEVAGNVTSGEEALRCYEHTDPNCLVTDLGLIGSLSGIDLVQVIREGKQFSVIFITGTPDFPHRKFSNERGCTETIYCRSDGLVGSLKRINHFHRRKKYHR